MIPHPMRCPRTTSERRHFPGFTLIEIMVAVVIIGLLAAIAIPTAMRIQRRAQNTTFVSDIRTFSQAFETYATKYGKWPANAASAGVVPPGMSGELRDANWTATASVGGHWNWDNNRNGVKAGISVQGVTASDDQMADIDAMIDDGDLSSGHFVKFSDRFTYILQK
jgi:prepilin-type N-terminal cleavage/methylation domain-containing protein